MIGKELLSAVYPIDETTETYVGIQESTGRVMWFGKEYNDCRSEIDIHRVAHKCKEWAVNFSPNKHALSSYARWGDIRNYKKTNGSYYICQHLVSGIQFEAESEPEAIFKACEWILTKDSK